MADKRDHHDDDASPVVRNAADTKQVDAAGKKQRDRERRELDDVRAVLATGEGRRVLWRLLRYCRVNQSVFALDARMAYQSGMQDVGHFVLGEIVRARPDAYLEMMHEHQENES